MVNPWEYKQEKTEKYSAETILVGSDFNEDVKFARNTRDRLRSRKDRGNIKTEAAVESEKKDQKNDLSKLIEEDQTDAKKRIEEIYIHVAEVLKERDGRDLAEIEEAELARYAALVARGTKKYKNEEEKIIADLVFDKLQQRALEGDQLLAEADALRKEKGIQEEYTAQQKSALMNGYFSIQKFNELNTENLEKAPVEAQSLIADKMIESGMADVLGKNLDKFEQLQPAVAEKFITGGHSKVVADNLSKFERMDNDIAMALLRENYNLVIVENLSSFVNLNMEVARKLLASNKAAEIAENISAFQAETHKDISVDIIENGGVKDILENYTKFSNVNYDKIVPDYPKKTTLKDLHELYNQPELEGGKLVDSLRGLKTFSFKEQVGEIIKSQGKNAHSFFEAVKAKYRGRIDEKDVLGIMQIAVENPLKGVEVLLRKETLLAA